MGAGTDSGDRTNVDFSSNTAVLPSERDALYWLLMLMVRRLLDTDSGQSCLQ